MEQTKVNVTIAFVPFGVLEAENYSLFVPDGESYHIAPEEPIYSFPSDTIKIEPAVLASNEIQVL